MTGILPFSNAIFDKNFTRCFKAIVNDWDYAILKYATFFFQ